MKLHFFAASLIALGTMTVTGVLTVHAQRGSSGGDWGDRYEFNIDEPDDGQVTSCDQIEVTVKRAFLARGEDVVTVAQPADLLRLSGPPNGGLRVRGEGAATIRCGCASSRRASLRKKPRRASPRSAWS